jgi:hypothetical protein
MPYVPPHLRKQQAATSDAVVTSESSESSKSLQDLLQAPSRPPQEPRFREQGARGGAAPFGSRARGPATEPEGGQVPPTAPLPNMPAPPPANDWFCRDLEGTVQGPVTEAQISEWHNAGYLPVDFQMRTADEPDSAYIALSELMTRDPNGEPPFLKMHRERSLYEAERERLKEQWEQMKTQEEERKRARAAAEEEKRLQRAHALERWKTKQQRLQQEQLNAQRLAQGAPAQGGTKPSPSTAVPAFGASPDKSLLPPAADQSAPPSKPKSAKPNEDILPAAEIGDHEALCKALRDGVRPACIDCPSTPPLLHHG